MISIPEGLSSVYFTTTFGNNIRFEPEIGFSSLSRTDDYDRELRRTFLRVGLGQFYVSNWKKQVRFFIGPRFGLVREWVSENGTASDYTEDATSIYISLCTGAEYRFAERFTLSGELQLGYIDYGDLRDYGYDESLIWYYK